MSYVMSKLKKVESLSRKYQKKDTCVKLAHLFLSLAYSLSESSEVLNMFLTKFVLIESNTIKLSTNGTKLTGL